MTIRNIIKIDEEKCNGCGDCIVSCPEGAKIIDGKARVVKESYCDGLGACIGNCPVGALSIERREAEEFDEEAVAQHMAEAEEDRRNLPRAGGGCPGSTVQSLLPLETLGPPPELTPSQSSQSQASPSQLKHWPVQLNLVPPNAAFLQEADVLLVADCVPFAMADFHAKILRGKPVVVGCPKLDDAKHYVGRLAAIFEQASLKSLTVVHMEVPCCGGLNGIVKRAIEASGRMPPVKEITIGLNGRVVSEREW